MPPPSLGSISISDFSTDDALNRLAPSLRKYEGCTLIDINPGLGLWSSKLHDLVRPRRHILAEPPSSPFISSLEPLVNQPESRYKLLNWEEKDVWEPERYIIEGLLPSPKLQMPKAPNHSILIMANVPTMTGRYAESQRSCGAQLKLMDWAHSISHGSGFHSSGPVRLLLWCSDRDTITLLPRTTQYRSKLSLLLEMTCHVEKIAGSGQPILAKQKQRDQSVELASAKHVAKLMQQSRTTSPAERQTELQQLIQAVLGPSQEEEDASPRQPSAAVRIRGWHKELSDLRQRFKAGNIVQAEGVSPGTVYKKLPKGLAHTPEWARMVELERNLKHVQKRADLVEDFMQEQAEIESLDLKAGDPSQGEAQRIAILAEMQAKKVKLKERLDTSSGRHTRLEFEYFKNDRKAYAQIPPLLMWDQRRAEPLEAYKSEFYPEKGLSLLDVEPKHPIPYPMTTTQNMVFTMLTTALWQSESDNLTGLDRIASGAFAAVTPRVPALRDPTLGGERDLHDLPIRRLTPAMMYELTMAWLEWPLRPDLVDLLRKGSMHEHVADRQRFHK
ncbi:MAG: hypothetical protein Q9220_007016 [cf. Caloplaca sp. 1 TL-2023]